MLVPIVKLRRKDKELQCIASDVQKIFSHVVGPCQHIPIPNSVSVTNVGTVQPKQFS